MKKLKITDLIVIGLGIFAFCFAVSKFVYCKFQMTSDYLTASATFFAAVIAMILFNDWREQYRIEMVRQLREKIHSLFIDLENKYDEFYLVVGKAFQGHPTKMQDVIIPSQNMNNAYEILLPELDFLIKILGELKVDTKTLDSDLFDFESKFSKVIGLLSDGVVINDNIQTITNYWLVLSGENFKPSDYLKLQKTLLNNDLQKIIIKLFTEK